MRYLEKELEKRAKLGKAVTIAGLAATITVTSLSATACDNPFATQGNMTVDGDMQPPITDELGGEDIPLPGVLPAPTIQLPTFETLRPHLEDSDKLLSLITQAYYAADFTAGDDRPFREFLQGANNWREAGMFSRSEPDGQNAITDFYLLNTASGPLEESVVYTYLLLRYERENEAAPFLLTAVTSSTVTEWGADAGDIVAPWLLLPEMSEVQDASEEKTLSRIRDALVSQQLDGQDDRGIIRHQSTWTPQYLYTDENADYYEISTEFDSMTQVATVYAIGLVFAAPDDSDGEAKVLERVILTSWQEQQLGGDPAPN